jgi:hypothetical protein
MNAQDPIELTGKTTVAWLLQIHYKHKTPSSPSNRAGEDAALEGAWAPSIATAMVEE